MLVAPDYAIAVPPASNLCRLCCRCTSRAQLAYLHRTLCRRRADRSVAVTRNVQAQNGAYSYTGYNAGLFTARGMAADAAAYSVSGQSAGIVAARFMTVTSGRTHIPASPMRSSVAFTLGLVVGFILIPGLPLLSSTTIHSPLPQAFTKRLAYRPICSSLSISLGTWSSCTLPRASHHDSNRSPPTATSHINPQ